MSGTVSPEADAIGSKTARRPGGRGREPGSGPDAVLAMLVVGAGCVVAGGLVAAVTEPLDLRDGSWLAAYLVLVGGVSQYAMGQVRRRQEPVPGGRWSGAWAQFWTWNLGNAAVIAGTLLAGPPVVVIGSLLLGYALVIALRATWSGTGPSAPPMIQAYRALLLVLIVSIPVGVLLSILRSG